MKSSCLVLKLKAALLGLSLLAHTPAVAASFCSAWDSAELGRLDGGVISESSGLALSRRFSRLYHINDSGDGPNFYMTEKDGAGVRKVKVRNWKPWDVEEISIGACPLISKSVQSGDTCLALADIGDNRRRRKSINIIFVKEVEKFSDEVDSVARVELVYPNGPRDAEAFGILPNGDFVIVSKERKINNAHPAQVFRVPATRLTERQPIKLEKIGEIDVPAIFSDKAIGSLVTAMSLSSDGKRLLLMTYTKALEFAVDLSAGVFPKHSELKEGRDFSVIPIMPLLQQEAVAYDQNDRDFYYTSELSWRNLVPGSSTPLMKMKCRN